MNEGRDKKKRRCGEGKQREKMKLVMASIDDVCG
jgi:hypothetical protein